MDLPLPFELGWGRPLTTLLLVAALPWLVLEPLERLLVGRGRSAARRAHGRAARRWVLAAGLVLAALAGSTALGPGLVTSPRSPSALLFAVVTAMVLFASESLRRREPPSATLALAAGLAVLAGLSPTLSPPRLFACAILTVGALGLGWTRDPHAGGRLDERLDASERDDLASLGMRSRPAGGLVAVTAAVAATQDAALPLLATAFPVAAALHEGMLRRQRADAERRLGRRRAASLWALLDVAPRGPALGTLAGLAVVALCGGLGAVLLDGTRIAPRGPDASDGRDVAVRAHLRPWDGEAYLRGAWLAAGPEARRRGELAARLGVPVPRQELLRAELAAREGRCDAARAHFDAALRARAAAALEDVLSAPLELDDALSMPPALERECGPG
jgi:hypothetical protein